jgi:hypothetical protein
MADTTNIITAADVNRFIGILPNPAVDSLNFLLQSYGLPTLSTVATGGSVLPVMLVNIVDTINYIAQHQATVITQIQVDPVTGTLSGLIGLSTVASYKSAIANNITLLSANRFNVISQQDSISDPVVNSKLWYYNLVFTHSITFESGDAARYFFNTGGQLAVELSHPTGAGINSLWSQLAQACGKIYISSVNEATPVTIAGTKFNGITKIGGSGDAAISVNNGYYALTVNDTQVFKQFASVGNLDYLQSNITLHVKSNGTRGSGSDAGSVITVTTTFNQVPMAVLVEGGYALPGTTATVTLVPPTEINSQHTWGTPTIEGNATCDLSVAYPAPLIYSAWNPNPTVTTQVSVLSWTTTNASAVIIGSTGEQRYATTGSKQYTDGFAKLTDTTINDPTFNETITAIGPGGSTTVSAPLRLLVPEAGSVTPIFTAAEFSAIKLNARKSCVLTWATSQATRVTVVGTDLNVSSSALSGSAKITAPEIPGIYSVYLTATSYTGDKITKQLQLEVVSQPTIIPKITASLNPSSNILPGQSVVVMWDVQDAVSLTMNNDALNWHQTALSGTALIVAPNTPGVSYPILLNATSASTDTSALQLDFTVAKLPTVICSADKYSVSAGQSVTFTWQTTDALSVAVSGLITSDALTGSDTVIVSAQLGIQSVYVTATSSTNESVTKTININVVEAEPLIPIIMAGFNPPTIIAGESTTLTWMTYNANAAQVSGIHSSNQLNGSVVVIPTSTTGKQSALITAYSTTGNVTRTNCEVLIVEPTPIIPVISGSVAPSAIAVGEQTLFTWTSTDSVSVTVNGLGFNSSQLSGEGYTFAVTSEGTHYILLTATSSTGHRTTNKVAVTAVAPTITLGPSTLPKPVITLPVLTFAIPYNMQLTVTGGSAPYQYTVSDGMLPDGLVLNSSTGLLSGTPTTTALSAFIFTLTATDRYGYSGTQAYQINVVAPKLTLTPVSLPAAKVNQVYSAQTITAAGGIEPYEFILPVATTLPNGITITNVTDTTFDISGTPTILGDYTFTITAVDSYGFSVAQLMNVTVTAVDIAVRPTRLILNSGVAKTAYTSETISASGGVSPYRFALAMGTQLPRGLSIVTIADNSAVIAGTPDIADQYGTVTSFAIDIVDSNYNKIVKNYSITINNPIIILSYPTRLQSGLTGQLYSATVSASGGTAPYSFAVNSVSQLPTGLTIESSDSTGTISGTPINAGVFEFVIVATDYNGFSSEQKYGMQFEVPYIDTISVPLEPVE